VKGLRSWYISYLAQNPEVPEWFAYDKNFKPKSAWKYVWDLPFEHALLALSITTLIAPEKKPTEQQLEKFWSGVDATMSEESNIKLEDFRKEVFQKGYTPETSVRHSRHKMKELVLPTEAVINSPSVARGDHAEIVKPQDARAHAQAYVDSWKCIPVEVVEWLSDQGKLDWIPPYAIGNSQYVFDNAKLDSVQHRYMGVIAGLQQEEGKLRTVANLNKVVQGLLEPLFRLWSSEVRKNHEHDCTFCEAFGTSQVQKWLGEGRTLSGADMSSATDLLDLDLCLWLINYKFFSDLKDDTCYLAQLDLFKRVSRGKWSFKKISREVTWKRGQPLGATPSFMLLTLTNYALAEWACEQAQVPGIFMVHGDDVILDSKALPYYVKLVTSFGGVINLEKTLTSSVIAEFNGKIITKTRCCNKRLYLRQFDDDSFLDYANWIGPGAEQLLRPRQRKIWEKLKYVPGIVAGTPYSTNSFGKPLADRVEWWDLVKPEHTEPDEDSSTTVGESLLRTAYLLGKSAMEEGTLPEPLTDGAYLALEAKRLPSGDPRKWDQKGKTLLDIFESHVKRKFSLIKSLFKTRHVDMNDPTRQSHGLSPWIDFEEWSKTSLNPRDTEYDDQQ
jgi:hypothetical protein